MGPEIDLWPQIEITRKMCTGKCTDVMKLCTTQQANIMQKFTNRQHNGNQATLLELNVVRQQYRNLLCCTCLLYGIRRFGGNYNLRACVQGEAIPRHGHASLSE